MNAVDEMIKNAYEASFVLQLADEEQVIAALHAIAEQLEAQSESIIKANAIDVQRLGADDPLADRLLLNDHRIKNIAASFVFSACLLPFSTQAFWLRKQSEAVSNVTFGLDS